jgi:predicted RNase H-like HicB family nuclease
MAYLAIVRKQPNSNYGVEFPDVPGCISCEPTMHQAIDSATSALRLHIKGMRDDGEEVPVEDIVATAWVEIGDS